MGWVRKEGLTGLKDRVLLREVEPGRDTKTRGLNGSWNLDEGKQLEREVHAENKAWAVPKTNLAHNTLSTDPVASILRRFSAWGKWFC